MTTTTATTKGATINLSSMHRKIDLVTAGLQPYLNRSLKELPVKNATAIVDYVLAMQTEINPTLKHRKNLAHSLLHFSNFHNHKSFTALKKKKEVLLYLDSYRKPEELDPLHKWIGTYNLRRAVLVEFFRWLYNPRRSPMKDPFLRWY